MTPIPFDGMNIVYKAPQDWDNEQHGPCGDLPVRADDEAQTCTSVWEPTDVERGVLVAGGKIVLTIHGGQPPVALAVML